MVFLEELCHFLPRVLEIAGVEPLISWKAPDGYVGKCFVRIADIQVQEIEGLCLSLFSSHFPIAVVEAVHAFLILGVR